MGRLRKDESKLIYRTLWVMGQCCSVQGWAKGGIKNNPKDKSSGSLMERKEWVDKSVDSLGLLSHLNRCSTPGSDLLHHLYHSGALWVSFKTPPPIWYHLLFSTTHCSHCEHDTENMETSAGLLLCSVLWVSKNTVRRSGQADWNKPPTPPKVKSGETSDGEQGTLLLIYWDPKSDSTSSVTPH